MASVNRKVLSKFLKKHAKNPKLIPPAMRVLEAFFVIAKSNKYRLAPASNIKRGKIARAISQVTGKPVQKVVFISLSKPIPQPEWMTNNVYKTSLWISLWISLYRGLGNSFKDRLKDRLKDGLMGRLSDSLVNDLEYSLNDNLWNRLRASLGVSLGDDLEISDFWDSLSSSLFYYLGFILLADEATAAKFLPLLNILHQAIPLGEKKGEPGTWLVLVG